jgi:hypothetical protein
VTDVTGVVATETTDFEPGSPESNDVVRAELARHGDNGRRVRKVLHFAYPSPGGGNTKPAVREFVALGVSVAGYRNIREVDETGVVFERRQSIASAKFDEQTALLVSILHQLGWAYDGWEAEVVRGFPPGWWRRFFRG